MKTSNTQLIKHGKLPLVTTRHDACDMLHFNQSQVNPDPLDQKTCKPSIKPEMDNRPPKPDWDLHLSRSPKRQILNFISNCTFSVPIGIFVRGAVIAYPGSRFWDKDSRFFCMNLSHYVSRMLIG